MSVGHTHTNSEYYKFVCDSVTLEHNVIDQGYPAKLLIKVFVIFSQRIPIKMH